jgi:hypothetical protein
MVRDLTDGLAFPLRQSIEEEEEEEKKTFL